MAVLVAAIVDQAKLNSDRRNDNSVAPTDWVTWTNRAVEALWRMFTAHDPAAYFAEYDFSLVGGTPANASKDLSVVTGPAFRVLHGLDLDPGTNRRRTVTRRSFQERNQGAIGWWSPALPVADRQYELRARTLIIDPYERAAGNYRAYYRGGPYLFTGLSDSNPIDWQLEPYVEAVEVMVTRRALSQEDSDTAFGSERLAEIRQELAPAAIRDDGAAAVIADVEDDIGPVGWRG